MLTEVEQSHSAVVPFNQLALVLCAEKMVQQRVKTLLKIITMMVVGL